jgi:hypothetical protein
MTRRSKRDVKRALDDLETELEDEETDSQPYIVHADPETDEWYEDPELTEGPIEKANADPVMVVEETIVETDWEPDS